MGLPEVTFVIPVAPYHRDKLEQAVSQVESQTIPVKWITHIDEECRGPAWARNRAVELVDTRLIAFLDADDLLDPTFTEKLLAKWRPGTYVHSDYWLFGWGKRLVEVTLPPNAKHHTVNCLMSKRAFELVGGFDEALSGLEDTEFWMRCMSRGICPTHVHEPLMVYTRDGQTSGNVRRNAAVYQPMWDAMLERYKYTVGCGCSSKEPRVPAPVNREFPGSILVIANWGGKRSWTGRATGRYYPPSGNGKLVWVDPLDQARNPRRLLIPDLITPEMDS